MERLLSLKQSTLLLLLGLLTGLGFLLTTLASYQTSRAALRESIIRNELPLAANSIYLEIQKDLVLPVQVASGLASDAFLLEWIERGEQNLALVERYLHGIVERHQTSTAFFASDRTLTYYNENGILQRLTPDDPGSRWYYRFKASDKPWEVVVDAARTTLFINYRMLDEAGRFVGVAGVGLTLDRLMPMLDSYQRRYDRQVFFVDAERRLVVTGSEGGPGGAPRGTPLSEIAELNALLSALPDLRDGSYHYQAADGSHFLNLRHIPALDWYLFIDKPEAGILAPIRRTLWLNLLICLAVTAVVLLLVGLIIRRYLQRIESLATRDSLTGLLNRRGFALLAEQALRESRRRQAPLCVLLLDLDHFKQVNDTHGHPVGDQLLTAFATRVTETVRQSDVVVRWGGEEFVVLLKDTSAEAALALAETLRAATEATPFACDGVMLAATLSGGLACRRPDEPLDDLLGRADEALYAAKRAGRNRVLGAPA